MKVTKKLRLILVADNDELLGTWRVAVHDGQDAFNLTRSLAKQVLTTEIIEEISKWLRKVKR